MVAGLRGLVAHEALVPLERVVPERDHLRAADDHVGLLEHRVQHRVQLLVEVLEEHRLPVLDRELEVLDVVVVERTWAI